MATVNTIEQRIREMGGGEFQKLCDAYLHAIGYGKPNSFGSKPGSNKVRKGTPDTFFDRANGKFVFAEYTTQQEDLFRKLDGDLTNCLDYKKTKVPVKQLDEIVICYTSQLEASEVLSLKSKCKKKGVRLTLLSISALAYDLLNHPFLIRNYLNLEIDTGQIISLESFPSVYGKSKFATTLETKFHFRDKEIEEFSNALNACDLLVISGKAGVGKSRFALEGCRNFVNRHSEYKAYSIVSRSQNLYKDLQERFSSPGKFLIFVDDANRVIDFSYFMYILRNQKDNQQIKIVITVRDYALDKIKRDVFNFPHESIQLERLTDDQIKTLAKDEFGISNPRYLDRIADISVGNPRIAVMVSLVAIEKNSLESINDVSALYDEYFSSIKEDLNNFGEPDLLRTAGILAFHRAVDRTNEQMMSKIQSAFCISQDVFWSCAFRLHELEMADMYEGEVVRISDQVLSTYLFYLAFFKEKVLDFSVLLQSYFPDSRSKINDSLFPVVNAFNQKEIFDLIRPKVHKTWDDLTSTSDDESLLKLAETFWSLLPTPTLSFIQKRLSKSQFGAADFSQLEQLDENKISNVPIVTELQILGRFRFASSDLRNAALDILFGHLETRPADMLQVLHVLIDDYGFDRFSNQTGVSIQQKVVDMLWVRTENGENELYSKLFISVGKEYLKTHFRTIESHSKMTITIYEFDLQADSDTLQLRETIFDRLFKLYGNYPKHILNVFGGYIRAYHQAASDEIFSNDATNLTQFIQKNLSPENLVHIIFVNDYLDFLENRRVTFDNQLRERFKSDTFFVYKLLTENRRDSIQYEYEEFKRIRKENFASYFSSFSVADITHFMDQCLEIGRSNKQGHDSYEIVSGFEMGMSVLAETRKDIFEAALSYYLQLGDNFGLNPIPFTRILMTNYGKERTFILLNTMNCLTKKRWLFGFYQILPPDKIGIDDLSSLYRLFQDTDYPYLPIHLDFLLEYVHLDNRVVAKATQLILDKGDSQYSAWILNTIINPHSEIHKHLLSLFKDDIGTLKRVYFIVKERKDHDDYNSATLLKILELDPEFIAEYIDWIYTPKGEDSHWYHDSQDYSSLWRHQNHREIFKNIIELVYKKEKSAHWYTELKHFFTFNEEKPLNADIQQKQEELLSELINLHHKDIEFIRFLFEVICYLPQERRLRLIFTFLQHNKNVIDFKQLQLESEFMSWSGSAVPVYQERIDYLKSLLPLLDSAQLLEHRIYIQQKINRLEYQLNLEKKSDFIGNEY